MKKIILLAAIVCLSTTQLNSTISESGVQAGWRKILNRTDTDIKVHFRSNCTTGKDWIWTIKSNDYRNVHVGACDIEKITIGYNKYDGEPYKYADTGLKLQPTEVSANLQKAGADINYESLKIPTEQVPYLEIKNPNTEVKQFDIYKIDRIIPNKNKPEVTNVKKDQESTLDLIKRSLGKAKSYAGEKLQKVKNLIPSLSPSKQKFIVHGWSQKWGWGEATWVRDKVIESYGIEDGNK